MKVYQVIMEDISEKEVIDVIDYVVCDNLGMLAGIMERRAKDLGFVLRSVKYILTVVETIPSSVQE